MSQLILPGTATPAQVLAGANFSAGTNYDAAGAMPNNGAVGGSVASNGGSLSIPAGYTTGGTISSTTDADLVASNIRSGVNIFGVTGNYSAGSTSPTGNASPSQVLSGVTFSGSSYPNGSTGTMPNNGAVGGSISSNGGSTVIPAGYTTGGTVTSTTDADLVASNIKSGVNIFGVTGTASPDPISTLSAGEAFPVAISVTAKLSASGSSYAKTREIRVNRSGTVRVKFDLKNDGNYTGYAQIYKNGVPVGTERSTGSNTTYTTFSEDISVSAGDLVQLYVHNSNSSYGVYTMYFGLWVSNTIPYATVTL